MSDILTIGEFKAQYGYSQIELNDRCRAAGFDLNSCARIVQPYKAKTRVEIVNAAFAFISTASPFRKIDCIKVVRSCDPSLGLKEAKYFVEGIFLYGTFSDNKQALLYASKINQELNRIGVHDTFVQIENLQTGEVSI